MTRRRKSFRWVLSRHARRRPRQRGQVLVVVGLSSSVLIGFAAIAMNTGYAMSDQRQLHLVADTAALAGSHELATDPNAGNYVAAQYIATSLGIGMPPWSRPPLPGCSSSASCAASTPANPYVVGGYKIVIADSGLGTIQPSIDVSLQHTSLNFFGAFSSAPVVGDSARAKYGQPPAPFPFALYSASTAGSGNTMENIAGDIYVGSLIDIQSNGMPAGFCTDPDPSGTTQGHIIFGAPYLQTTNAITQYVSPYATGCAGNPGKGAITAAPKAGDCSGLPANVTWVAADQACVANPPIGPPIMDPPNRNIPAAPTTGMPAGSCTLKGAIPPGIYEITSTCPTFTFDAKSGALSIPCVSFLIDSGVDVVFLGKPGGTLTSYGSPGCPGATASPPVPETRGILYSTSNTTITFGAPSGLGCCGTFNLDGTVYVPAGTVSIDSNIIANITGQAIVGAWDYQEGNHPGVVVTYDPTQNPPAIYLGGLVR